MSAFAIKGLELGSGQPKIIVPLMGADVATCLQDIETGKAAGADCFEWRGDFADVCQDINGMVQMGQLLASAVPNHPLLFTFRTANQGGNDTLDVERYVALNRALIDASIPDLIDIEAQIGDNDIRDLVHYAHDHNVRTVVSYHDFEETPPKDQIIALVAHMVELGADIPKIAVMAHNTHDVLELLSANEEVRKLYTTGPLLTLAMGSVGSITRLAGEYFGSDLTFCSLSEASAPGQVDIRVARTIIDELHEVLSS